MPESAVWESCVSNLQNELPAQQFNTWIRPLRVEESSEKLLRLLAPNRFVLDWVNDKFRDRIQELLNEQKDECHRVLEIQVAPRKTGFQAAVQASSPANGGAFNHSNGSNSSSSPIQDPVLSGSNLNGTVASGQTNMMNGHASAPAVNPIAAVSPGYGQANGHTSHQANGFANGADGLSEFRDAVSESSTPLVSRTEVEGGIQHKSNLNSGFIFSNFVVGKSNQLGLAAATQVAENPGDSYNPLFIYGGVGLGKTHLMHAIGNALIQRKPGARVVYLHSERFVADMVKALQLNAINDFKRYYRSVDALLIDDIQFFANKERSQEEFFHTFNALLEGGQQIILTCDRYPKEIDGLEERLKSRFGWGLTVAIEPPELETRVAILKRKAEQAAMNLPNDAAFFIAQRIRSNVRELEGALKRVIANAHFTGREISVELVREALKDLLALQDRLVSVDNIQRIVAEYYKIKVSDLHSKRRSRSVARPRQVAMYLAKDLTHHSLPEIGEVFGGRDHTTVLHACRKIKELLESDADIREDVKNLLRTLTT